MIPHRSPLLAALLASALSMISFLGGALAQTPAPTPSQIDLEPTVQTLLEQAQSAMTAALERYDRHYPDRPLWRDAIRAARQATELAPGALEPLRLLAEVYSRANWHSPAWEVWNAYLDTGAALTTEDAALVAGVGHELGYAAYRRGDKSGALERYERVAALLPDDREAQVWAGRILLEQGRPAEALRYWQLAAERDPSDGGAAHFLQLARLQAEHGVLAGTAFMEGLARYEAGELAAASSRFAEAARAAPGFDEAERWAGRTLLERGLPERALPYWESLLARHPNDAGVAYFLELSRDAARWGLAAASAFREGVSAYESGEPAEAAARFQAATEAAPENPEAWAWRGRVAFEASDFETAGRFYARASELAPEEENYRYFRDEALRRAQS